VLTISVDRSKADLEMRLLHEPYRMSGSSSDQTLEVGSLIQVQEPTVCGVQPVRDAFGLSYVELSLIRSFFSAAR
jgi:hypothetical protein